MKKNLLLLSMLFALPLFFTACNKDTQDPADDTEITTSEDVLTAQDLIEDTQEEIDYELENRDPEDDCPIITVDPNDGTYPRTITIDYGIEGCEGWNGRIRKGIILITVTDTMINEGAMRTVEFVNFSVDDVQIAGTKTFTNNGLNADGQLVFTRVVSDASLTFPNGDVAEWNATQTLTLIEGAGTPQRFDDVMQIEGGSNGVNRHGKAFTSEITEPLIKPRACPWIVSGIRTVNVNDHTWTLDYGDGECNKVATLTRPDGTTKVVLIRRWW
ncbi:MAG: hypothetical protein IPL49_14480 [Saprospirales bacterium]|nr:hypothetical protein [Saprospirales bacterium]MBK8492048.1 hypothetical protein [Saprospirales bacterium]